MVQNVQPGCYSPPPPHLSNGKPCIDAIELFAEDFSHGYVAILTRVASFLLQARNNGLRTILDCTYRLHAKDTTIRKL